MSTIHPQRAQLNPEQAILTAPECHQCIVDQSRDLIAFTTNAVEQEVTFDDFERGLQRRVCALARTAITLFLCCSEERVRERAPTRLVQGGRAFQRTRARQRGLTTMFGTVRYRRTYMREIGVREIDLRKVGLA